MPAKGKHYSKLQEEEELFLFKNEGDDKSLISDSERSIDSSSDRKLSKRHKAVLASFIVITLAVVVTVSVVLTQKKEWLDNSSTKVIRADRKFTLQEVLSGKYSSSSYSTQWVSDLSYLHTSDEGGIKQYNMDKSNTNEVMTPKETLESNIRGTQKLSPDIKWFLFANNTRQLYRHSMYADYYVKNLETGVIKRIPTPDEKSSEQIRYLGWSKKGNALAFVYTCNIYYVPTVEPKQMQYFKITSDGLPKKVFNGIPDWVYEEEIIASTHALEFSSNGKYMAYVMFNATDVPFYRFPRYGVASNQYTTIEKIAYPKAGYPNPTIKLKVIDLDLVVKQNTTFKCTQLIPPAEMTNADYYYAVMRFNKEQVFVQWLNRNQNSTMCMLYNIDDPKGIVTEEHKTENGWIDDDYVKPYFAKDGSYYLTMLPKNAGNGKGDFRHLAKVTRTGSGGYVQYLTEGAFTVQDLNCYNEDEEIIYFRSTEVSPRYRHVYSINVTSGEKECITCGLIKDTDGTDCTYYYPQFSTQCSWVTLMCQGPFVPVTNMYNVKTKKILILTDNNRTKASLAEKDIPTNVYYTIKSDGYDIPVRETRPANFNPDKKYAVLFDVYGGPNTQKILDMFGLHFNEYLITNFDIIAISMDARGSGYYGYEFLYAVYRNLGYYESVDAINVAKYLQKQSYVDPDRIAIWGWSYGGFYSATVLAMAGDVIKTAVAVAPVTDWRYYDTVYSERYMGFPSKEDNLRGYERTAVMARAKDFAGKNFLLIHGTADDNVHFQNSAQLVNALIKEKVRFRSQFYTDKDHGINPRNHLYMIFAEFLEEKLNLQAQ